MRRLVGNSKPETPQSTSGTLWVCLELKDLIITSTRLKCVTKHWKRLCFITEETGIKDDLYDIIVTFLMKLSLLNWINLTFINLFIFKVNRWVYDRCRNQVSNKNNSFNTFDWCMNGVHLILMICLFFITKTNDFT